MEEMTYEDEMKFIKKLTDAEIHEILGEAQFHQMTRKEWLNSHWAEELRQRVMERE